MAMFRRFLVSILTVALTAVTISGCESLRQAIRSSHEDQGQKNAKSTDASTDPTAVESDPTKIQAVDSNAKNPQPFFKNNRPSGGWSSEAREIEANLGVGP